MDDSYAVYVAKSRESLAGAESEFANGRYNNSANRCYYACFQAAIVALIQAGVKSQNPQGLWGHDFVQATFNGVLIYRRKLYPASFRTTLERSYLLRQTADYENIHVAGTPMERILRQVRLFVETITREG
jgi:uncharacterized protein (UPF0332 family)